MARIAVNFRRNQTGAEAEAHRLATQLDAMADTVEVRSSGRGYREPTVLYFTPADREAALSIARALAGAGGATWTVRPGPKGSKPGSIEVYLP